MDTHPTRTRHHHHRRDPNPGPNATLDYRFDWSAWLDDGETITTHQITATGVTLDSSAATADAVTAWVSGGTAGTRATVACQITTSDGRTDERTVHLTVRDR